MDSQSNFIKVFSVFLLWLFNISAIAGVLIGNLDWFMTKTPATMLLILGLLLFAFPIKSTRDIAVFLTIVIVSIFAEWLGVNYGLIFGEYVYGENLGPKIGGVPLLIGTNWAVLTFVTGQISSRWFKNKWTAALSGACLMLLLDFFMESSAPVFDFWYWEMGHPPLQNFVGWFSLAFLFHLLFQWQKIEGSTFFSYHLYASQLIFFLVFYLFPV